MQNIYSLISGEQCLLPHNKPCCAFAQTAFFFTSHLMVFYISRPIHYPKGDRKRQPKKTAEETYRMAGQTEKPTQDNRAIERNAKRPELWPKKKATRGFAKHDCFFLHFFFFFSRIEIATGTATISFTWLVSYLRSVIRALEWLDGNRENVVSLAAGTSQRTFMLRPGGDFFLCRVALIFFLLLLISIVGTLFELRKYWDWV